MGRVSESKDAGRDTVRRKRRNTDRLRSGEALLYDGLREGGSAVVSTVDGQLTCTPGNDLEVLERRGAWSYIDRDTTNDPVHNAAAGSRDRERESNATTVCALVVSSFLTEVSPQDRVLYRTKTL